MAMPTCVRATLRAGKSPKMHTLVAGPQVRHSSIALKHHITSEGLDITVLAQERGIELPSQKKDVTEEQYAKLEEMVEKGEPYNVRAMRMAPLRHSPTYGIPCCDLQLRTYNIRNMELFADFAMRAAYYLKLPAKGPIPLPKITERWTVPRSNFVHKKSQENFERITQRRLIQIQDGNPETVRVWLGVLMKYQYHGVGMKANIWEHESLDAVQTLEKSLDKQRSDLTEVWRGYGTRADAITSKKIEEALRHPAHTGILADIEKEQGLERGAFQRKVQASKYKEAAKTRKSAEDKEAEREEEAKENAQVDAIRDFLGKKDMSEAEADQVREYLSMKGSPDGPQLAQEPESSPSQDPSGSIVPTSDLTGPLDPKIVESDSSDASKTETETTAESPAVSDVSPEEAASVEAASKQIDAGVQSTSTNAEDVPEPAAASDVDASKQSASTIVEDVPEPAATSEGSEETRVVDDIVPPKEPGERK